MGFIYFGKVFPRKAKIYVLCKKFFLDELVLMLFSRTADSLRKTRVYCLVRQFSVEKSQNYNGMIIFKLLPIYSFVLTSMYKTMDYKKFKTK